MSNEWMTPDPEEAEFPPRHIHLPVLPTKQRRELSAKVRRLMLLPRHERGGEIEALARSYGVTGRTAYRYTREPALCPGFPDKSCLTLVSGGGLCSYCRRTLELAGRVEP